MAATAVTNTLDKRERAGELDRLGYSEPAVEVEGTAVAAPRPRPRRIGAPRVRVDLVESAFGCFSAALGLLRYEMRLDAAWLKCPRLVSATKRCISSSSEPNVLVVAAGADAAAVGIAVCDSSAVAAVAAVAVVVVVAVVATVAEAVVGITSPTRPLVGNGACWSTAAIVGAVAVAAVIAVVVLVAVVVVVVAAEVADLVAAGGGRFFRAERPSVFFRARTISAGGSVGCFGSGLTVRRCEDGIGRSTKGDDVSIAIAQVQSSSESVSHHGERLE